jgi:hypothetical protein
MIQSVLRSHRTTAQPPLHLERLRKNFLRRSGAGSRYAGDEDTFIHLAYFFYAPFGSHPGEVA